MSEGQSSAVSQCVPSWTPLLISSLITTVTCVLVTFLLLWLNTIVRASHRRKSLVWVCSSRGLESLRMAWRHGRRLRKRRVHILNHKHEAESELEMTQILKFSKPLLQWQGHNPQIYPNRDTTCRPSIHAWDSGKHLIQTTTPWFSYCSLNIPNMYLNL